MGPQHAASGPALISRVATLPEASTALSKDLAGDLELWSPENGAEIHGVMWFYTLQHALRMAFPDREPNLVIDCGSRGDLAIEALRVGLRNVALRAPAEVTEKVTDIAAGCGGRVITTKPIFP